MNVSSRLNLTPAPLTVSSEPVRAPEAEKPAPAPTPEPKESTALSRAVQAGMRKGVAWGEGASTTVGGAVGLGVTALAGYAMTIGGAAVGAAIGGGLGPMLAAVSGAGPLGILAGAFTTAGAAAKVGMVLGGVTGTIGAWQVGTKVGGSVAKAAGFVPGFVAGAVEGLAGKQVPPPSPQPVKEPKPETKLDGAFKPLGQVIGGASAMSGAVGGLVVGGTLAAAGGLAHAALSSTATLGTFVAALPTTALVGGAVGAALMGYLGGKGALQLVKGAKWAWDHTAGKLLQGRRPTGEALKERKEAQEAREQQLNQRIGDVQTGAEALRTAHKAASENLTRAEDRVGQEETASAGELKQVQERIETRGQEGFRARSAQPDPTLDASGAHGVIGKRETLDQWSAQLEGWKGTLDEFEGKLTKWEAGLDARIDQGASDIFAEERKPIDQHFGSLRKELDAYEKKLDEFEARVRGEIKSKFESRISVEKPPVEGEVQKATQEANSASSARSRAQEAADQARSELKSAESAVSSARRALSQAESENSSLHSDISRLRSRISDLERAISRER